MFMAGLLLTVSILGAVLVAGGTMLFFGMLAYDVLTSRVSKPKTPAAEIGELGVATQAPAA
jgi:hypothetical protein